MLQHLQKSSFCSKNTFQKRRNSRVGEFVQKGSVLQLIGLRINVRDCRQSNTRRKRGDLVLLEHNCANEVQCTRGNQSLLFLLGADAALLLSYNEYYYSLGNSRKQLLVFYLQFHGMSMYVFILSSKRERIENLSSLLC